VGHVIGVPSGFALQVFEYEGSPMTAMHAQLAGSLGTPSQSESSPSTVQESAGAGAIAPLHCPYVPLPVQVAWPYLHGPCGAPPGQLIGVPVGVALQLDVYEGSPGVSMQTHPSLGVPLQLSSLPATRQLSFPAGAMAPLHCPY
jgi:hypothetical protein